MAAKSPCSLDNLFAVVTATLFSAIILAQNPVNDRPQPVLAAALDSAVAPYVAKARKSYPAAKLRFLRGLPADQAFFVTVQLSDAKNHTERVFIHVTDIRGTVVSGFIANEIYLVDGFKAGQRYAIEESELLDWLIARPDGSEEGNFVGKFLDTYKR